MSWPGRRSSAEDADGRRRRGAVRGRRAAPAGRSELAVEHADLQDRVEELADQLADAERPPARPPRRSSGRSAGSTAAERDAAEAADARDRAQAAVDHLVEQAPG